MTQPWNGILHNFAKQTQRHSEKLIAEAEVARLQRVNRTLLEALKLAADTLISFDGGNPKHETGWQHDELREAWVVVTAAIANAERKP